MRRTIVGCVSGAAAILALAACSNSATPATATRTTAPRTTPPAAATAPSTAAPSTAAPSTTSPATTTSCTALMAAWYDGSDPADGKDAVTYFRSTLWSYVIPPGATTLADQHAAAHALLGDTLTDAEPKGGPPACNSAAAVAWDNGLTALGDAATIEQSTTTLGPATPAAEQDATYGFEQLGIAVTQGELAATAATTETPAAPTATPAPRTTVVAGLWCNPSVSLTVVTSPSLAAWKTTNGYGVVAQLKTGAAAIDNPATPAATAVSFAGTICADVQAGYQLPPPVEQATWNEAMGFFLMASTDLHAVTNGANYDTSLAGARVEANLGLSDLNEFLSLTGA
jgi:hypothetical protein